MHRKLGFTLIEIVISMVVLSIVSIGIGVFMRTPVDAYEAAKRRAALASNINQAGLFVIREIRVSLPNSVRLVSSGGDGFIEFVPLISGGRYRDGPSAAGDTASPCPADSATLIDNSILDFGNSDTCFKSLGLPISAAAVAANQWLVINNQGAGYTGANFYETASSTGGNKARLTSASVVGGVLRVGFESASFRGRSAGNRFFVADASPTTYACKSDGTLMRYTGYAVSAAQPTNFGAATSSIVLKNLSQCVFNYTANSVSGRFGVVSIRLKSSLSTGEQLEQMLQAHVSNVP